MPALTWLALLVLISLFTPGFLAVEVREARIVGAVPDILANAAPVMLAALGMTLVMSTRGIDLGVGSTMAICSVAAALMLGSAGAGVAVSVTVSLAVGAAIGLTSGLIVAVAGVPPVVATLVLLIGGRGLAQTLAAGQVLSITSPGYAALGTGAVVGVPVPVIVVFIVLLTLLLAQRFTVVGLYLHAVGSNPVAARLAGLRVSAVQCAAYTASGVLGALAGLIASGDIRAADPNHLGVGVELDAILAAVIGGNSLSGGRPRLVGAAFGALIMQTATVALQMWSVPEGPTLVLKAGVAIAACAAVSWRPGQGGSMARALSESPA